MQQQRHKVKFNVEMAISLHTELKILCAQERMRMADFVRTWVNIGIQETKKKQLHERLLKGFQQVNEGKYVDVPSEQIDQWIKELEDESA